MTKGGYNVSEDFITFSIETQAEDGEVPFSALLCLADYPRHGIELAVGTSFLFRDRHEYGWDDKGTHANAYFDFHVEDIELSFEIVEKNSDVLTVRLWALTEEYGYDNSGENPQPIVGTFKIGPKPKSELWIPS